MIDFEWPLNLLDAVATLVMLSDVVISSAPLPPTDSSYQDSRPYAWVAHPTPAFVNDRGYA